MEDINDAEYTHTKRVCKDIEIKGLVEYHDLYVLSHTLFLGDVFDNFRNMSWNIWAWSYSLFFCTKISMESSFNLKIRSEIKLDLLTDIDMLLMVEKDIRGEIFHSIYQYAKANNIYMKDYDKNEELLYLKYCDVNDLHGWAMSLNFSVNNFEWIKDTSKFNEDFIKNCNEGSNDRYFLKIHVQYPEKLHKFHEGLPFLPETMKIE